MQSILEAGIGWNLFLQHLGAGLKTPMEIFSFLGNEYFFLLLLPTLYWSIEAGMGLRVGFILLVGNALNDSLKLAFHTPRPYWVSPQVIRYASETSFGMPSGHAQTAVGVWGMLAACIRKWWAWLAAVLIILLISLSRIYLGVHFNLDVLLGLLVGILLLWLVLHFWQPVTAWGKHLSLGAQIGLVFLFSVLLILLSVIPFTWLKISAWQPASQWSEFAAQAISLDGAFTSGGTLFGFLAGLAWFSRQGGFSTAGPFWKRLLRFLLGMVGVLVLYLGLDTLFTMIAPDAQALLPWLLRFIRYALVGAWVAAGAPWLFVRWKLAGKAS